MVEIYMAWLKGPSGYTAIGPIRAEQLMDIEGSIVFEVSGLNVFFY